MPGTHALLAAEILASFTESVSARFDSSLTAMPLNDVQRRELKYWQRQSLVALQQYAAVALPAALAAVDAGAHEALASMDAAGRTWDDALAAHSSGPDTARDSLEQRRQSVAARLASGA